MTEARVYRRRSAFTTMALRSQDERTAYDVTEELSTYYDLADEEIRDNGSQSNPLLGHNVKKKSIVSSQGKEFTKLDSYSMVILPGYKGGHPHQYLEVCQNETTKGGGESRVPNSMGIAEGEFSCEAFHSATAIGQCEDDDSLYSIQSRRPKKSTSTDSEINPGRGRLSRTKRGDYQRQFYRRRSSLSAEKVLRRPRRSREERVSIFGTGVPGAKTVTVSGYSNARSVRGNCHSPSLKKHDRQTAVENKQLLALYKGNTGVRDSRDAAETVQDVSAQLEHEAIQEAPSKRPYDHGSAENAPAPRQSSSPRHKKRGVRLSCRTPNGRRPTISSRSSNLSTNTNDSANNTTNNTSMVSLEDKDIQRYCAGKSMDMARNQSPSYYNENGVSDQVRASRAKNDKAEISEITFSVHHASNNHLGRLNRKENMDDATSNAAGNDLEACYIDGEGASYLPLEKTKFYDQEKTRWPSPAGNNSFEMDEARLIKRARRSRQGETKHILDCSVTFGSQRHRLPIKRDNTVGRSKHISRGIRPEDMPPGRGVHRDRFPSGRGHIDTTPGTGLRPQNMPPGRGKLSDKRPPGRMSVPDDMPTTDSTLSSDMKPSSNRKTLWPKATQPIEETGRSQENSPKDISELSSGMAFRELIDRARMELKKPETLTGPVLSSLSKQMYNIQENVQRLASNPLIHVGQTLAHLSMSELEKKGQRSTENATIISERPSVKDVQPRSSISVSQTVQPRSSISVSQTVEPGKSFGRLNGACEAQSRPLGILKNSSIHIEKVKYSADFNRYSADNNIDNDFNTDAKQSSRDGLTRRSSMMLRAERLDQDRAEKAESQFVEGGNQYRDSMSMYRSERGSHMDKAPNLISQTKLKSHGSGSREDAKESFLNESGTSRDLDLRTSVFSKNRLSATSSREYIHGSTSGSPLKKLSAIIDETGEMQTDPTEARSLLRTSRRGSDEKRFKANMTSDHSLEATSANLHHNRSLSRLENGLACSDIADKHYEMRDFSIHNDMKKSKKTIGEKDHKSSSSININHEQPISRTKEEGDYIPCLDTADKRYTTRDINTYIDRQNMKSSFGENAPYKSASFINDKDRLYTRRNDNDYTSADVEEKHYDTGSINTYVERQPIRDSMVENDIHFSGSHLDKDRLGSRRLDESNIITSVDIADKRYKYKDQSTYTEKQPVTVSIAENAPYAGSGYNADQERLVKKRNDENEFRSKATFDKQEHTSKVSDSTKQTQIDLRYTGERLVSASASNQKENSSGVQIEIDRITPRRSDKDFTSITGKIDHRQSNSSRDLDLYNTNKVIVSKSRLNKFTEVDVADTQEDTCTKRTFEKDRDDSNTLKRPGCNLKDGTTSENRVMEMNAYLSYHGNARKDPANVSNADPQKRQISREPILSETRIKLLSPKTSRSKSWYRPIVLYEKLNRGTQGDTQNVVHLQEPRRVPYVGSIHISSKSLRAQANSFKAKTAKRDANSSPTSQVSDWEQSDSSRPAKSRPGSRGEHCGIFYHDSGESSRQNQQPFRYHKTQTSSQRASQAVAKDYSKPSTSEVNDMKPKERRAHKSDSDFKYIFNEQSVCCKISRRKKGFLNEESFSKKIVDGGSGRQYEHSLSRKSSLLTSRITPEPGSARKTHSVDRIGERRLGSWKSSKDPLVRMSGSSSITNVMPGRTKMEVKFLPRRLSAEKPIIPENNPPVFNPLCDSIFSGSILEAPKKNSLRPTLVSDMTKDWEGHSSKIFCRSHRRKPKESQMNEGMFDKAKSNEQTQTFFRDSSYLDQYSRLESQRNHKKEVDDHYFKSRSKRSSTTDKVSPPAFCSGSAAARKDYLLERQLGSEKISAHLRKKSEKSPVSKIDFIASCNVFCQDCTTLNGTIPEDERNLKGALKEVTWKDDQSCKTFLPSYQNEFFHPKTCPYHERRKRYVPRSNKDMKRISRSTQSCYSPALDEAVLVSERSEGSYRSRRISPSDNTRGKRAQKYDSLFDGWMTDDDHASSRSFYSTSRPSSTSPYQRDRGSKKVDTVGARSSYTSLLNTIAMEDIVKKEKSSLRRQSLTWPHRNASDDNSESSRSGKLSLSYSTDYEMPSTTSLTDTKLALKTPRPRTIYKSNSSSPECFFESPSRRYRRSNILDTPAPCFNRLSDTCMQGVCRSESVSPVGAEKPKHKEKKADHKPKEPGDDHKSTKPDKKDRKESKSGKSKQGHSKAADSSSPKSLSESPSLAKESTSMHSVVKAAKKSGMKPSDSELHRKPSTKAISEIAEPKEEERPQPKVSESNVDRYSPKPASPPLVSKAESKSSWAKPSKKPVTEPTMEEVQERITKALHTIMPDMLHKPSPARTSINDSEMPAPTFRQKPPVGEASVPSTPTKYPGGNPCDSPSPVRSHLNSNHGFETGPSKYGSSFTRFGSPSKYRPTGSPLKTFSRHQYSSPTSRDMADCPPLPRQPSNNNSISQSEKCPKGTVVYQNALRYACFNGVRVVGGVRVILDAPCKQGYVQIISPLNEVFISHYINSMTYLSATSAAGVAWSGIAYKGPGKCDGEASKTAKKVKTPGQPDDGAEGVSKVDVVQIVFCDPYQAHRYRIVVETIQCAFTEADCMTLVTCHKYGCPPCGPLGPQTLASVLCDPCVENCQPPCSVSPGFVPCPTTGFIPCPVQNSSLCKAPTPATNCGPQQSVSPGDFLSVASGCSPCPVSCCESQFDACSPQVGMCQPDGYTGYPCKKPPDEIYDPYAYEHCMEKLLFSSVACLVKLAKDKTWLEMQQGMVHIKQCANGMGFSLTFECTAKCGAISHYIRRDTVFERAPRTQHGFIYNTITSGEKGTYVEEYLISFQNKCQADNFKMVVDRCHRLLMMTASRSSDPTCSCNVNRCMVMSQCGNNNCARDAKDAPVEPYKSPLKAQKKKVGP